MSNSQKAFLALIAVMVVQAVWYYQQLPETVASHFDGAGHADGWSSKMAFFLIMLGTAAAMALLFLALPKSFGKIPAQFISLPNRDYWLSDEKRGETIRHIEGEMGWFGVATMVLLIVIQQLTINANLGPEPALSSTPWWILGGYLLFTTVWTIRFVVYFTRTGDR
jgi:uncharacterized membrane protein